MAEERILGIDLGTTNSVVAVMEGADAKVRLTARGGCETWGFRLEIGYVDGKPDTPYE